MIHFIKQKIFITLVTTVLLLVSLQTRPDLPPVDSQNQPLPSLAPMIKKVIPGVVNLSTTIRVQAPSSPLLRDPFFRRFFELPNRFKEKQTRSLGSGVIVDAKKGYILTNHHLINKAIKIQVTLQNGQDYAAQIIGSDKMTDIAVIKIDEKELTALEISDSGNLEVGDFVVAIGNPFGLGQTVTSGIISALGRSGLGIEGYEDFIQTDASINPGNSGGALVNLRGELIGINTAILAPSGGNVGIGFAIPIKLAKNIMLQLIEHGAVKRGTLGISFQNLNADLAKAFGLKSPDGAVIVQVFADSPAYFSGIKVGDIITKINQKNINNAASLNNELGLIAVGETIDITLQRDNKTLKIKAKLSAPDQIEINGNEMDSRLEGAWFSNTTPSQPNNQGVIAQKIYRNSAAWIAGLRKGDLITSLNRKKITNVNDMIKILKKNHSSLLLSIQRRNLAFFLLIE